MGIRVQVVLTDDLSAVGTSRCPQSDRRRACLIIRITNEQACTDCPDSDPSCSPGMVGYPVGGMPQKRLRRWGWRGRRGWRHFEGT